MSAAPLQPLSRAGLLAHLAVALCLLFGGCGVGALAGGEAVRFAFIQAIGEPTQAKVIDTRTSTQRKSGTLHELRYRVTDGAGRRVGATDVTGREGLWVAVPQRAWEDARRSGHITVDVVPGVPGLHAPRAAALSDAGDLVGAGVLAALLGGIAAIVAGMAVARRRVALRAAG